MGQGFADSPKLCSYLALLVSKPEPELELEPELEPETEPETEL